VAAHKLLLLPADPSAPAIGLDRLAQRLLCIGLIGRPVPLHGAHFYPTGDRFLQLVTFLGCAPTIELDPPADPAELDIASREGRFCHVFLTETGHLQFRADSQTRTAHCPQCRKPQAEWPAIIRAWQQDPEQGTWQCAACGHTGRPTELQFRKTAGFGKTWVEIRGIHPAEAVPGDALLATLRALTGCNWNTLYIRE
jgi:hypothetical protein